MPVTQLPEPEMQPSKLWKPQEGIKARVTRGEQLGEYLLEWEGVAGIIQYEVQEFSGGEKHEAQVAGTCLPLKDLAPGYHTFRVRALTGETPADWSALESCALNVPGRIQAAPANVKVILNKNKTFTVQWKPLRGSEVEQYHVYEVIEKGRRLAGTVGDLDRCLIEPDTMTRKIAYVVCAANWSGEGPASRPAVFDPAPRPSLFESLSKLTTKPQAAPKSALLDEPKPDNFRCKTRDEVCSEITRRLAKAHVHMTGLQVEQKYQGTEEYRSIDKRSTTELISLNLAKGPEYRMIIYGSKGEKWLIPITFDRLTWDFILTFTPISKKK